MNLQEIVTDKEIIEAFKNTNFGEAGKTIEGKQRLIAECLLKSNCNYHDGYTITLICSELGLFKKNEKLNKKGKRYLFEFFINQINNHTKQQNEGLPNNIKVNQLLGVLKAAKAQDVSINVQAWQEQTAVYIEKDGTELESFGGDAEFALREATDYLNRINQNNND